MVFFYKLNINKNMCAIHKFSQSLHVEGLKVCVCQWRVCMCMCVCMCVLERINTSSLLTPTGKNSPNPFPKFPIHKLLGCVPPSPYLLTHLQTIFLYFIESYLLHNMKFNYCFEKTKILEKNHKIVLIKLKESLIQQM